MQTGQVKLPRCVWSKISLQFNQSGKFLPIIISTSQVSNGTLIVRRHMNYELEYLDDNVRMNFTGILHFLHVVCKTTFFHVVWAGIFWQNMRINITRIQNFLYVHIWSGIFWYRKNKIYWNYVFFWAGILWKIVRINFTREWRVFWCSCTEWCWNILTIWW